MEDLASPVDMSMLIPTEQLPFVNVDHTNQNGQMDEQHMGLEEQEEQELQVQSRQFLLTKFTLYETKSRFYIIGSNSRESRFRTLEIDITGPQDRLAIKEINGPCTRSEIMEVLNDLEKELGGLTKRLTAWGLLGFIRFTEHFYLCAATKRSPVALIGGHFIYHIDDTELVPLVHSAQFKKPDRKSEEARFASTFQSLDLGKTFYFSNSYDITHTLQYNLVREKKRALGAEFDTTDNASFGFQEMFVWNSSLLRPVIHVFPEALDWFVPITHGFIDQAKISVSGRSVLITIIARRSHYFAGARFLKRGVNDQGNVANEVETEQIVCDFMTNSFHDPRDGIFNNPRYTSFVQHRGSIPLYWSQDVSNMSPKPPIELNSVDPFFSSAALHFDSMFQRYGRPILVLNLIKSREKVPRESKLGKEFKQCTDYLNQQLPQEAKIQYTAWDMSKASKGHGQEVIEFLESYAESALKRVGYFHNGKNLNGPKIQDGICRTNCIDCLDRTNAAQFVIGKKALGYQLHALGLLEDTNVEYDSDAVNLLTEMFHDHGDTIALQYGGSHLVNTMETYRKINQWTSHSRDLIESIRRFYSNSFVDSQRQDAINLFLGNYVWEQGKPTLWEYSTDYYLHNNYMDKKKQRSYVKWWIPKNLLSQHDRLSHSVQPPLTTLEAYEPLLPYRGLFDNYWNEYYRPRALTSFHLSFTFNMNSTLRYLLSGSPTNVSPFKSRKDKYRRKQAEESKNTSGDVDGANSNRKPDKAESIISSINNGKDSIRRQALKRASLIYQSPGLPKMIADRVFSGRIVEETREDVAKFAEDSESAILSSSLSSLDTDGGLPSQVERLLSPEVSYGQEKLYEDYVASKHYSMGTSSDVDDYIKFINLPSKLLSGYQIDEIESGIYERSHKLATLPSDPRVQVIPSDDSGEQNYYLRWLDGEYVSSEQIVAVDSF
jgi:phosphatidylinositol 3,5-bisphosphate 5-phosphatase